MEAQSNIFSIIIHDPSTGIPARFGKTCSLLGKCNNESNRILYPKRILFSCPPWPGLVLINSIIIGETEFLTGELTDGQTLTSWRELSGIPPLQPAGVFKFLGSFTNYIPPGFCMDSNCSLNLSIECE